MKGRRWEGEEEREGTKGGEGGQDKGGEVVTIVKGREVACGGEEEIMKR